MLRCQSYIDIHATINGDGTHGGLAGLFSEASGIAQIQDCIFAGSINGDGVNCCGGLVGWATAMGLISNCLMAGDMNIDASGGDVICRNNSKAIIQDTYYYTDWNGTVPATASKTDSYDMASGALCYQLNAGRTAAKEAWFQTLSEDPFPVPDNRHLPVWSYDGSYTNEDPDGIKGIKNDELRFKSNKSSNGRLYDLSGRQLSNSKLSNRQNQRGIYIKDGRKVYKQIRSR